MYSKCVWYIWSGVTAGPSPSASLHAVSPTNSTASPTPLISHLPVSKACLKPGQLFFALPHFLYAASAACATSLALSIALAPVPKRWQPQPICNDTEGIGGGKGTPPKIPSTACAPAPSISLLYLLVLSTLSINEAIGLAATP